MRVLIKNGRVIDPANNIDDKLNLLIFNGKIEQVTKEEIKSDITIDATDKIVCPGFIDIHMHEDLYNEETDELIIDITTCMLNMGVTSCIGGNCGINTNSPKIYLEVLDKKRLPVNLGLMVGHANLRKEINQLNKYKNVGSQDIKYMKKLASEYLEAGCFGISYGIRYVPGINEEELLEISNACQRDNKIITAHVRDDANNIIKATKELVDIGIKLNLPIQNSHIGSMGGFGQMEALLEFIESYRNKGLDISSDCYPYYAFSTRIGETTYDEGFLERYNTDYSVIEICEGKYKGQRCTKEVFEELRQSAPSTMTVAHVMKANDVDLALCHPNVILASDGILSNNQGHPRAAGTFPRFINNYVKENKITINEAINKMSSMPAKRLGLYNKGNLSVGSDADIVIFSLENIKDTATFKEPTNKPKGIEYVLIGGEFAIKDSKIVNLTLGKSLRQ